METKELKKRMKTAMQAICRATEQVLSAVERLEHSLRGNGALSSGGASPQEHSEFFMMMHRLETSRAEWHTAFYALLAAEAEWKGMIAESIRAEARLKAAQDPVGLQALHADVTQWKRISKTVGETAERLQDFGTERVPAFCRRAAELADAEHSCKGFRTPALAELCGRFLFAGNALLQSLREKMNAIE